MMNVSPAAYKDYFKGKITDDEVAKMTDSTTGLIMNPESLEEALNRPNGAAWKFAHDTEWNTICKMGTFSEWMTLDHKGKGNQHQQADFTTHAAGL